MTLVCFQLRKIGNTCSSQFLNHRACPETSFFFTDIINVLSWIKVKNEIEVVLVIKNLPANAGDRRDVGLISESGKSPGSTPVFLPGESHGQRSLAGYSPRGSQRVGHDWSNSAPMHACMGGYESTSMNMNQPLHFAKQEWWSAFTKAASMLGIFHVSLCFPLATAVWDTYYCIISHLKKLKFSNVTELVKCHTRSSRIRVQAEAYSTTDLSLFLLHPATSLGIITVHACGPKTPLIAVNGLFSLMAFRGICSKNSL